MIRYSYLWADAHHRGQEEGVKDRPCAVILVVAEDDGTRRVTVLPITHSPPVNPTLAVEIPATTKRRLGLDDERSWVVLSEANRFTWPGPDLRPVTPGDLGSVAYGPLPLRFYEQIRQQFIEAIRATRAGIVPRSQ